MPRHGVLTLSSLERPRTAEGGRRRLNRARRSSYGRARKRSWRRRCWASRLDSFGEGVPGDTARRSPQTVVLGVDYRGGNRRSTAAATTTATAARGRRKRKGKIEGGAGGGLGGVLLAGVGREEGPCSARRARRARGCGETPSRSVATAKETVTLRLAPWQLRVQHQRVLCCFF